MITVVLGGNVRSASFVTLKEPHPLLQLSNLLCFYFLVHALAFQSTGTSALACSVSLRRRS